MEVAIRPFRPGDWDGVFQLDRACFEPPYRLEYPRLRALIEDPGITVVVIEAREGEETAIVGSLMAKHDGEAGRLVLIGIMVDPGFRRAGLGRRLAGWAERIARARSLTELLAPLEAENEAGAGFLTALGFTRESGVPPFFNDPAGGSLWRCRLPAQAPAPAEQPPAPAPPEEDSAQAAQAPSAAAERLREAQTTPAERLREAQTTPAERVPEAQTTIEAAPAPEPQESDRSAGSPSRQSAPQAAEAPVPALPQLATPARVEPVSEPDRSAAKGAAQEPPPSDVPGPPSCVASEASSEGEGTPSRTSAGPRSKAPQRQRAAAERVREAQKKFAGKKRRRT